MAIQATLLEDSTIGLTRTATCFMEREQMKILEAEALQMWSRLDTGLLDRPASRQLTTIDPRKCGSDRAR